MVTKEKFNSFDLSKRYLIAASDFARAASRLKANDLALAELCFKEGYQHLEYIFEFNPRLRLDFVSYEDGLDLIAKREVQKMYDIYVKLMTLGGCPLPADQTALK